MERRSSSSSNSQVFRRPAIEGAKYGAIAGLIATWSISTAIAASELELGLPIGTFYAVMGISLGSMDFVTAAYLGFGLHVVTGTILGAIIGGIAVRVESKKKNNKYFQTIQVYLNRDRNRHFGVAGPIFANNCFNYSAFNWQNLRNPIASTE